MVLVLVSRVDDMVSTAGSDVDSQFTINIIKFATSNTTSHYCFIISTPTNKLTKTMAISRTSAAAVVDLTSLFQLPSCDITDRLNNMIDQEQSPHYQTSDYLRLSRNYCLAKKSARRLSPSARTKVVRWLYDIVDYFALQRETVDVAMSYVDRFMSNNSSHRVATQARRNVTTYQLVAVACLFIATKTSDYLHIDAKVLVRASRGCYTVDEITDMENTVLKALEWRLSGPTSLSIAYHAIALLNEVIGSRVKSQVRKEDKISSVVDFARLQIELSVSEYNTFVLRSPSSIALAAVLNSMDLLDFKSSEINAFRQALGDATGICVQSSQEIHQVRQELNVIFDKQSEDVMTRASGMAESSTSVASYSSLTTTFTPVLKHVSLFCAPSPTCVDGMPTSIRCSADITGSA